MSTKILSLLISFVAIGISVAVEYDLLQLYRDAESKSDNSLMGDMMQGSASSRINRNKFTK